MKMALLLTPLLVAPSPPADADQYVCVPAKVVECDSDLSCGPPAPELIRPTFFHMDLDKRVITLLGPAERRGETTEIRYVERDGDRVILGGVEAGRPWSMVLWESDGRMTLTANVDDAGWVAFGQCMAAGQFVP
jgi:hypothetical protein